MLGCAYFVTEPSTRSRGTWSVTGVLPSGDRLRLLPSVPRLSLALYLVHYLMLPDGCFGVIPSSGMPDLPED